MDELKKYLEDEEDEDVIDLIKTVSEIQEMYKLYVFDKETRDELLMDAIQVGRSKEEAKSLSYKVKIENIIEVIQFVAGIFK